MQRTLAGNVMMTMNDDGDPAVGPGARVTGTAYSTEYGGAIHDVFANWAEASCPVFVRYDGEDWTPAPHGRQVADYRHSQSAAMREWLLVDEDGDDPGIIAAVDAAVSEMVEAD